MFLVPKLFFCSFESSIKLKSFFFSKNFFYHLKSLKWFFFFKYFNFKRVSKKININPYADLKLSKNSYYLIRPKKGKVQNNRKEIKKKIHVQI